MATTMSPGQQQDIRLGSIDPQVPVAIPDFTRWASSNLDVLSLIVPPQVNSVNVRMVAKKEGSATVSCEYGYTGYDNTKTIKETIRVEIPDTLTLIVGGAQAPPQQTGGGGNTIASSG